MKKLVLIIFAAFLALVSHAGQRDFIDRIFVSSTGLKLPYKVLLPENFNPEDSYPLILFLHGSGERGSDNNRQITHGGKLLLNDSNLRNAVVIAPQCPRSDKWADYMSPAFLNRFPESPSMSEPLIAVKELADSLIHTGYVDNNSPYV